MTANVQAVASTSTASSKKLFYRIKEVAEMMGLKAYVLRYWETEFPELAPEKDSSDQRRYRDKDIHVLRAIRKLLYEDKFTIKGARPRLKEEIRSMASGGAGRAKKTRPAAKPRRTAAGKNVDESLTHLRREVKELIEILGASGRP
jgi:DNA-binding transcriptional MerR regulator